MRLPSFFRKKAAPARAFPQTVARVAPPIEAPEPVATEVEAVSQAEVAAPMEAARSDYAPAEIIQHEPAPVWTVENDPAPVEAVKSDSDGELNDTLRAAGELREGGRAAEARTMLEAAAERFPEAAAVRHDLAKLAEAEKDWAEAERQWRAFAALSPTVWWGVGQIAHLLRLQGRLADAEALVGDALERFPTEAPLFLDHARMAEMRRDWPEASVRWSEVAERFPDMWEGLTGQGRVLREQGKPDQAHVLLTRAVDLFPAAAGPVHELARVAESVRDWSAAEWWWREGVALDPGPWWAYTSLANALREQKRVSEAEAVLSEQFERMPHEPWLFMEHARLAERSADWPNAARRWDEVSRQFPDRWEGYGGHARALREQGELTAARDVLIGAVARFPALHFPLHDLARLAEGQSDWAAAEEWWRKFIALDAGPWWGYAGLSAALREQGRGPEGEAVLAEQFERLSNEAPIFLEYARFAERSADWPEAAKRYAEVARRFPNAWDGYVGQARALRQQGDTAAASAVLLDAHSRFPSMPQPLHDLARLAEAQRDWSAAEGWWRQYIATEPGPWFGYVGLASALREQGQPAAASEVLAGQLDRLVHEPVIFVQYATLAERERDWPEALRRWELMVSRFPGNADGHTGRARSLFEMEKFEEVVSVAREAAEHFPANAQPLLNLANLAAQRISLASYNEVWAGDDDGAARH
jgi:predicted Zn-dependent protease